MSSLQKFLPKQIDILKNYRMNSPPFPNHKIVTQQEELSQVTIFIESERDFLLLIQEQIQKQSFEYQNLEIIDQIKKLLKIQNSEENASTIIDKDNQTKKTLSLKCLPDVKVQLPRLIEANNKSFNISSQIFSISNQIKKHILFQSSKEDGIQLIYPIYTKLFSHQNFLQHQSIQLLQLVLMEKKAQSESKKYKFKYL